MNYTRRVLLLADSQRGYKSPSESLGDYLLSCLHRRGLQTVKVRVNNYLKSKESINTLLSLVENSGIIIISCSVYEDGPSEPVIRDMEFISQHLRKPEGNKDKKFFAVLNYNFPDAQCKDAATYLFRRFARECGLEWIGCLNLGMGRIIEGKSLDKMGFIVRNVRKSLNMAAEAIVEGKPLPGEAVYLMEKPIIPVWLYTSLSKVAYKSEVKKDRDTESASKQLY